MSNDPPADLGSNLGLAQQCWHMAQAACRALGREFEHTSPSEIMGDILEMKSDLSYWLQLAKYQREWFHCNHEAGTNAGPCPTDAGIDATERLLAPRRKV